MEEKREDEEISMTGYSISMDNENNGYLFFLETMAGRKC